MSELFTVRKGTNISHWLSQSRRRGAERREWFTRSDAARIAGFGFDHIRLPVDEEQLWTEGGGREPEAFDLLGAALEWCRESGLKTIVDLHILRSHYFNQKTEPTLYTDPAEAARFVSLWEDLSDFLRETPCDRVAYELMNEPIASDPADWNRVARAAFDAVRRREPRRVVVLGSNRWQSTDTFDRLDVPDDRRMLLSFHYYTPILVTHHQAGWNENGAYTGPVSYPGTPVSAEALAALPEPLRSTIARNNIPCDRAAMVRDLAAPLAVRARTGLPLYCGEFGCYEKTPRQVRDQWYRDIVSVLAEAGIGWANWDYKGSFGILDRDGRDAGILDLLLRRA